jgi:hypothetical protein
LFNPNNVKKIIFKWNSLKVGLHKGHASRATPMPLGSERHSPSPNNVKNIIFKWSFLKVGLYKGHASRTTPMSLGSEKHLFSPNCMKINHI